MNQNSTLPWFPVFHVPHDGNEFPEELIRSVCIPLETFLVYHEKMRDRDASALIPLSYRNNGKTIAFPVSRLLCDVERFTGPEEVMEQYGMGFCYEKAYDGTVIKHVTEELREKTRRYYDIHHASINRLCEQHRRILFFDMHSYTGEIIPAEFLRTGKTLPDLCIGVDYQFTPPELARAVLHGFQEAGLTIAVNDPYSGCYVPEAVMNRESDCEFAGIMLEFHRRAYLDEQGSLAGNRVEKIREVIRRMLLRWGCMG